MSSSTIVLREKAGKLKIKKQVETNRWEIGQIDSLEIVECVKVRWVDKKRGTTYEALTEIETILGCDAKEAVLELRHK